MVSNLLRMLKEIISQTDYVLVYLTSNSLYECSALIYTAERSISYLMSARGA